MILLWFHFLFRRQLIYMKICVYRWDEKQADDKNLLTRIIQLVLLNNDYRIEN